MPGIPGNPGFYFVKRLRKPEEVMKEVKKPSWAAWVPSETR